MGEGGGQAFFVGFNVRQGKRRGKWTANCLRTLHRVPFPFLYVLSLTEGMMRLIFQSRRIAAKKISISDCLYNSDGGLFPLPRNVETHSLLFYLFHNLAHLAESPGKNGL